jgi:hypothetical protein
MGFTRMYVTIQTRGLLHLGSTLTCSSHGRHRRSISVALSFSSRRLDVIQHPRPTEPGLSSHDLRHQRLSVKLRLHYIIDSERQATEKIPFCVLRSCYTRRNGLVLSTEAMISVSYFCSLTNACRRVATAGLSTLSMWCPASMMHIPVANASCAV